MTLLFTIILLDVGHQEQDGDEKKSEQKSGKEALENTSPINKFKSVFLKGLYSSGYTRAL